MKEINSRHAARNTSVVLKSTIWYTAATVLKKGLSFLTIPIYARLMTKAQLGDFDTYTSWITLFSTVLVFDLPLAVIRAKNDVGDDLDGYASSVLSLTTVVNLVFLAVVMLFKEQILTNWMGLDDRFILPMFLYLFLDPATEVFAAKQRAVYKYKTFVVATVTASVVVTFLSILLIETMDDKLAGRFYGYFYGFALVGLVFYIIVLAKGRKISMKYWKDSFLLCFPLVLHLISLYILSASDKIMITKLHGSEYTGVYSIANSVVAISAVLMHALNRSWAPWMLDMLSVHDFDQLKKYSVPYVLAYFTLVMGCMLFAPEIVWFLGGEQYHDAVYLIPPLLAGTMFSFIYQMYLQAEFFSKKTKLIGVATTGAALINVGLNLWLIPTIGYIAAGYTTLIGYIFMFGFHFLYASKLGYRDVFYKRFIFGILIVSVLIIPVISVLYRNTAIRFAFIGVLVLILVWGLYKYRNIWLPIIKKRIKR